MNDNLWMVIYVMVGKLFLLFFRGLGLILFFVVDIFFGLIVFDVFFLIVDFLFVIDIFFDVCYFCFFVFSVVLIFLFLIMWKMKMRNFCKRVIDDFDKYFKVL